LGTPPCVTNGASTGASCTRAHCYCTRASWGASWARANWGIDVVVVATEFYSVATENQELNGNVPVVQ